MKFPPVSKLSFTLSEIPPSNSYLLVRQCFLFLKPFTELSLYHTIPNFNDPENFAFEIMVGNEEIASNQQ